MMRIALSNSATLFHADCRDAIRQLPDNSIDAVVTDPPYALVSIVKRFGGANAAPAKGNDAYMRASAGFMGKQWDTGEVAFSEEFWAEVLRVLKPGGHVAAFGASRGYHRMACAIEDAGFEIRDSLMWVYGTGFPKSHDVSKGIDKIAYSIPLFETVRDHLRQWRDARGLDNKALNEAVGSATNGCGMARHWTSTEGGQHAIPSKEQWQNLKRVLAWPDCELDSLYATVKDGAERPVIGKSDATRLAVAPGQDNDRSATVLDVTAAATDAARQWEGWGTALKPAFEPIVLARKPLSEGTVAANVLRWGTGALNVGACRVGTETLPAQRAGQAKLGTFEREDMVTPEREGRWPANVVHDGSDEVVGAFSVTKGDRPHARDGKNPNPMDWGNERADGHVVTGRSEPDGSAARFFQACPPDAKRFHYSAKASKADRAGSKHPTVKPVSLMEWLATLITPPGGTILDPFAGSGTTGAAARNKGFPCILIEREDEYVEDIRRRLGTTLSPEVLQVRRWNAAMLDLKASLGDRARLVVA